MRTHEVLQAVGIPRERLYCLERKRYITPARIEVGEKQFREYSDEDVAKVRVMWRYLQAGYRYNVAHEKALAEFWSPELGLGETAGATGS